MSYEFPSFAQQGWQCPICKRVYSPYTVTCLYCGNKETITTTEIKTNAPQVSKKDSVNPDWITWLTKTYSQQDKGDWVFYE